MSVRGLIVYFVLAFLGLTVLLSKDWVVGTIHRERVATQTLLGEGYAKRAYASATEVFREWFVDTGIQRQSFAMFIPDRAQVEAARELPDAGEPLWRWMAGRVEAFWAIVYQILFRVSVALQWWPFMVLVLVPAMLDAFYARRIRRYSFGLISTQLQSITVHLAILVVLGYVCLMLLPVFVHPMWFPAIVLLSGVALWIAMVHFARRA